jgi:hypothetical protein
MSAYIRKTDGVYISVPKNDRRDRMVVGFTTTYAISAHDHLSCEFESAHDEMYSDTTVCENYVIEIALMYYQIQCRYM